MNLDQLKTEAESQVLEALDLGYGANNPFSIEFTDNCSGEDDESTYAEARVNFDFKNCHHSHYLMLCWDDVEGLGFEIGENGDVQEITPIAIYAYLYSCIATAELDQ